MPSSGNKDAKESEADDAVETEAEKVSADEVVAYEKLKDLPDIEFRKLRVTENTDCSEEEKEWYMEFWDNYAEGEKEFYKQIYLHKRSKDIRIMASYLKEDYRSKDVEGEMEETLLLIPKLMSPMLKTKKTKRRACKISR